MNDDQEQVLILREDGWTTIRYGLRMDDRRCKSCGHDDEYMELNEVWVPTEMENAVISALLAPQVTAVHFVGFDEERSVEA